MKLPTCSVLGILLSILAISSAASQIPATAGPRYDWAATRFRESGAKVKVEYLSSDVSGDLAYTVAIERSEVRLSDQDKPATMALRVTHVMRKENGVWKLVHRHADPITVKTAPATVLQRSGN